MVEGVVRITYCVMARTRQAGAIFIINRFDKPINPC